MKKTRLGLAVSIALVASASHSQEVAIQSLLNYPVPEGYERAYSEQINVDGTDFFRTGFINVKSGDMIDLVVVFLFIPAGFVRLNCANPYRIVPSHYEVSACQTTLAVSLNLAS